MGSQAFIISGLQNDLADENGVCAKNGLSPACIEKIIPNVVETLTFCHDHQIPTIGIKLTILQGLDKKAIGLGIYETYRPFLEREGFRNNTWGHNFLEELPSVDYEIIRWGISAFYDTHLNHYLNALGIKEVVLGGFSTNGAIQTLAREALGRNYHVTVLSDCVTSYSESLHESALTNLDAFGTIISAYEWQKKILFSDRTLRNES